MASATSQPRSSPASVEEMNPRPEQRRLSLPAVGAAQNGDNEVKRRLFEMDYKTSFSEVGPSVNHMALSSLPGQSNSAPPTPQGMHPSMNMNRNLNMNMGVSMGMGMGMHQTGHLPQYRPQGFPYEGMPSAQFNYQQQEQLYHHQQQHQQQQFRMMNPQYRRATFPGPAPPLGNPVAMRPTNMASQNFMNNNYMQMPPTTNHHPMHQDESVGTSKQAVASVIESANLSDLEKKSNRSFPVKLHKMLSNPSYRQYITWLPHGRAFKIRSTKGLEQEVLSKFFRSGRYESFMRQVNGWGFKRITEGPDQGAYYHEMFLRGLPDICTKMKRPGKGSAASKTLGECPNFYKISMYAPLPEDNLVGTVVSHSHSTAGKVPSRPHSPSSGSTSSLSGPESGPLDNPDNSPIMIRSPEEFIDLSGPLSNGSNHQPIPLGGLSPVESYADLMNGDLYEDPGMWGPSTPQRSMQPTPAMGNNSSMFNPVQQGQFMPISFGNGGSNGNQPPQDPFLSSDASVDSREDINNFSVADLQYLTEQNKFLLSRQDGQPNFRAPV